MQEYRILVTNDDGIHSPGLRAAVEAALKIGTVTIAAPSNQQTGMGRSLTGNKQAQLEPIDYHVNGTKIQAYHCDCSPALVVRHCLKTVFHDDNPDLLISGINYGENLGINVTCSGTVGAALEGASSGIAAIAISKQTDVETHYKYTEQDWSGTSYFLEHFAKSLLTGTRLQDVDVLKIDVPHNATKATPWKLSNLARTNYYTRVLKNPSLNSRVSDGKTEILFNKEDLDPQSDIYVLAVDKLVSVTPLSVDITSRVEFTQLTEVLHG